MVVSGIAARVGSTIRRIFLAARIALAIASIGIAGGLYWYAGIYGFNLILRRGGSIWNSRPAKKPCRVDGDH
jgi:hypothetical protein